MSIFTFNYYLRLILIKTGISKIIPLTESQTGSKKNRKVVSQNHGFRKFTIMANKRINPEVREILLGRKICLSSYYYRPSESELLEEYSRVVPELTINEENRLSRQVQELKEKDDYQNYVIDKKLKEKDEQIKILTSKVDEYVEVQREGPIMSKEIAQRFSDLEEKFNDLMGVKKKERKYNREFELESNSKTKDEKHDLMLQTTRDRIRKQGEIEQHLQKYTTQ